MNISKIVLTLIALVVVTGCKNKDGEDAEPLVTQKIETLLSIIDSENDRPLEKVEFDKSVRFVLELKNLTDQPIDFRFASGKQYDLEVRDENEQLVWNWAHDKVFIQAQTTLTVGGNEQIKFTSVWDQKNNEGIQVAAGQYSVM